MAFTLCKELGFASPRYLYAMLFPWEITYWLAYYNILHGKEAPTLPELSKAPLTEWANQVNSRVRRER